MSDFVYSSAEIRAIEALHAKRKPKVFLMLQAGKAVADFALGLLKKKRDARVLVLAGAGNNGGDAWVAANALCEAGVKVTLVEPAPQRSADPVAQRARVAYRKANGIILTAFPSSEKFDLIVDGLFGIGLRRPIAGAMATLIASANGNADFHRTPILAIDIPSGLAADSGVALGAAIHADYTLTFLGAKPGLYTADGADHAGEIHVDMLGVTAPPSPGRLLTRQIAVPLIPTRRKNSHKGSHGSVGIIGGANGMAGAAVLAARAALHTGAGKVYLGMAADNAPGFDTINPEIMVHSARELLSSPSALTALAIGMGLGTDSAAKRLLRTALTCKVPQVIDADALTIISSNTSIRAALKAQMLGEPHQCLSLIFTPHPGEAARLLGIATAEVQADRVRAATAIASHFGVVAILKGAGTIIAEPSGSYWINTSGNPGMASGGMGDALSGMIAAFLAGGMAAMDAAKLAVYLHGAAADECLAHGMAPLGLTASEVIFEARTLLNAGLEAHDHDSPD